MTRKRMQVPAYTDSWMSGDRYGTLFDTHKSLGAYDAKTGEPLVMARIHLDKSDRVRSFLLDDCTEVE